MDSFKIYLPSNASFDHFPNNTPSNFQTHLTDPIQLNGEWEAGVESIFYSKKIGDEKETVKLSFDCKVERKHYITDSYPYKFSLIKDNKWQIFDAIPDYIVEDTSDNAQVAKCLNSINNRWVLNDEILFAFKFHHETLYYVGSTNGVVLDIPVKIARYFGFGYQHIFCGNFPIYADRPREIPKQFTKDDYYVKFVDTNVLQQIARIIIKNPGSIFPQSNELLQQLWEDKLRAPYGIDIEFSNEGKLIVHNVKEDITVKFSRDFSKSFDIAEAIIGRKTEWSLIPFDSTKPYENDAWYIDLYSNDIGYFPNTKHLNISYEIEPRIFDDVRYLIPKINRLTKSKLKAAIESAYDEEKHNCKLSFLNKHVEIAVGKEIKLEISKNLAFMLGFDENRFESGRYTSKRLPATLEQREQHLFILSDIIQSVSYGDQKIDVFEEFVHDDVSGDNAIVEKRFHPISYHPIKRSYIENIHIQLVNEMFKSVFIKDSKTIVILHLRKRN